MFRCDVKAAVGAMTEPTFPLPWKPQPLPPATLRRMSPLSSSPLNRLATSFSTIPILSTTVTKLLCNLRDLAFFDDFNTRDVSGLTSVEHDIFRRKAQETEHELLDYPHQRSSDSLYADDPYAPETQMHPLEEVTRIAALLHISLSITVASPASGLGRALVIHLKNALDECRWELLLSFPPQCLDLMAWVLFLGSQGSQGQIERPWFVDRIADVATIKRWKLWSEVARPMEGYLYVQHVHEKPWKATWEEVSKVLATRRLESWDLR